MSDSIQSKILSHISSPQYSPAKVRRVARELELHDEDSYPAFRQAVRELMDQGKVMYGAGGALVIPTATTARKGSAGEIVGIYSHNRRGFGFVAPSDPTAKEDLFIPPNNNNGAMTGDTVRARIVDREQRDGKTMLAGKVVEIIERGRSRFAGELQKVNGQWYVLPDGNVLTTPIHTPDAASRHIRAGTKVVVELTEFPEEGAEPVGVISEVLGAAGEKDVDLRAVIIAHNLPEAFPEEVKAEARAAVQRFDPEAEKGRRTDLSGELIVTIDPDDAKDYDDAISLRELPDGRVELGVHIADVSHFVTEGSALDEEAKKRGNSTYFPGHVIPMLPEILSNGVCSLQEGVPRLCKSAFITLDEDAKPVKSRFAETVIHSAKRLRYREAQDLIDGKPEIYHPDGNRKPSDYEPRVIKLLKDMDTLARRIQKRRHAAGQLVLELPVIALKLDEGGKVVGTEKEDTSFTHTLIEMFMVEANEAVARLFHWLDIPFIRRIHPEPDISGAEKLSKFVTVAGHKLPKELDRHAIQRLTAAVKGRPESYAINLAILKSLTRAEYSPQVDGHYALASQHYTHFTSPIRRYADLMIHRLLKAYLEEKARHPAAKRPNMNRDAIPSFDDLVMQGRAMSYTERRSEDAERELKQVKVLELLGGHIGEDFAGVVTGVANFGIFVQLSDYLIEGVIRYDDLMDDWWDVDAAAGVVRGQRTGRRIGIGDACLARVVRVDPARRELALNIVEITSKIVRADVPIAAGHSKGRRGGGGGGGRPQGPGTQKQAGGNRGGSRRGGHPKSDGRGKPQKAGPAQRGGGGRKKSGKRKKR